MGTSLEGEEHPAHRIVVVGLSQDPPSFGQRRQVDDGVGGQDDPVRGRGDGQGFATSVGLDGLARVGERHLGEVAAAGFEVVARRAEQVHAAGGFGGQDELQRSV